MANLINLTPHPVTIVNGDKQVVLTLPKADNPVRLTEVITGGFQIDGIDIAVKGFDRAGANLPAPSDGTYFVVSLAVAQAFVGQRFDLLVPDALVRDDNGAIVGATRFSQIA